MTFWRYLRLPAKWTQQGVGRVVMRDSALSLSAIVGKQCWPLAVVCCWSYVDIDWSVIMLFMTLSAFQVIKPIISGNITY